MAEPATLHVSVALAEAGAQRCVSLELPAGATAWQAVLRSGLLQGRDDLDQGRLGVAIYGRQVERGSMLEEGDRVEILRPLPEDPKLRRRSLARRGETLGRGRSDRSGAA